jgi:glutamyl/glutaminyl-tRNA synthetase
MRFTCGGWRAHSAAPCRFASKIHDRERSRVEFERCAIDDLQWLGFVPDFPAFETFRAGATSDGRQSDHPERYTEALAHLSSAGLTYWCDCSRQRIARDAGATGPGTAV